MRADEDLISLRNAILRLGGGIDRATLIAWGVQRTMLDRMLRRGWLVRTGRGCYIVPGVHAGDPDDYWAQQRAAHVRSAMS